MAVVIFVDPNLNPRMKQLFLFHMTGLASLTTIINGTSVRLLIHMLRFVREPIAKAKILNSKLVELRAFSGKYLENSKS